MPNDVMVVACLLVGIRFIIDLSHITAEMHRIQNKTWLESIGTVFINVFMMAVVMGIVVMIVGMAVIFLGG
jgi:hypothetical protein